MSVKAPVFFGMVMFLIGLVIFLPVFPVQAEDRQAQCEAWAKEDGLEGKDAQEYVAYCVEEVKGTLAPEGAAGTN